MSEQQYFKSAFSIDNVIFGFDNKMLKILLIKRGEEPYLHMWALPGDLVYPTEDLDNAPKRILKELTGLDKVFLQQVHTFGEVNRHPLGRVITVAYYSLVNISYVNVKASSFAEKVDWMPINEITILAFDHLNILKTSFAKLKQSVRVRPLGFELLPELFTLSELQDLYEAVLEKKLDKRNFRKKIKQLDILIDMDRSQKGVAHRPAKLYKFNVTQYEKLKKDGMNIDI